MTKILSSYRNLRALSMQWLYSPMGARLSAMRSTGYEF